MLYISFQPSLIPRTPHLCSSVCLQRNTCTVHGSGREVKNREGQGVLTIGMTSGGHGGEGVHIQIVLGFHH